MIDLIDGQNQTLGNDWFLRMPGIAERFAQEQGFGDLFASGFNPGDGLFDGVQQSFSPELAARLAQYDVGRVSGDDRMRQDYVIDRNTGETAYADDPFKVQSTLSALGEGLGFVGGAVLGGSALAGSGLFGGAAAGAAPVAAGGAMDMGAGGVLEAMGGGGAAAGTGTLASQLLPFTPYDAAPLALSGTAPVSSGFLSTAGLPALAGSSGSGLFSQAGNLLRTPGIGQLVGTLGGGLLGGALAPDQSRPTINMTPKQATTQAPMQHAPQVSQGLPSGLGSSSAGLFDEYMKQQLGGGRRTYYAPTFGGG